MSQVNWNPITDAKIGQLKNQILLWDRIEDALIDLRCVESEPQGQVISEHPEYGVLLSGARSSLEALRGYFIKDFGTVEEMEQQMADLKKKGVSQ